MFSGGKERVHWNEWVKINSIKLIISKNGELFSVDRFRVYKRNNLSDDEEKVEQPNK